MADDVRPFRIDIAQSDLDDLADRLARTRWPEPETVDDWSQGIPLAYTKELAEYWAGDYDWRSREAELNRFDHFLTDIGEHTVHFIHQRSPHDDATPLIISHGWPGSIVEFHKVIEPLTDPTKHGGTADDAFHVVCPSLIGYGFSSKPTQPGTTGERIADAWSTLMARLGYDRYLAQGGDWGSMITTAIGAQDPEHCIGIHTNMPIAAPKIDDPADIGPREQKALDAFAHYDRWDSGYSKQQSSRPQTLGYGLTDSPVGQMAWIVEKFWAWMDCDGHPENVLTKDELLDNVMLYWLSASGASSARLYWESFANFTAGEVDVPTGASIYPYEIIPTTREWASHRYRNIVYWNELDRGGHFAAFEQPELFVGELRACFALMR